MGKGDNNDNHATVTRVRIAKYDPHIKARLLAAVATANTDKVEEQAFRLISAAAEPGSAAEVVWTAECNSKGGLPALADTFVRCSASPRTHTVDALDVDAALREAGGHTFQADAVAEAFGHLAELPAAALMLATLVEPDAMAPLPRTDVITGTDPSTALLELQVAQLRYDQAKRDRDGPELHRRRHNQTAP